MRTISIAIEGAVQAPRWETLQTLLREAVDDEHLLMTRLSRKDESCNYRAPGEFEADFRDCFDDIVRATITIKQ